MAPLTVTNFCTTILTQPRINVSPFCATTELVLLLAADVLADPHKSVPVNLWRFLFNSQSSENSQLVNGIYRRMSWISSVAHPDKFPGDKKVGEPSAHFSELGDVESLPEIEVLVPEKLFYDGEKKTRKNCSSILSSSLKSIIKSECQRGHFALFLLKLFDALPQTKKMNVTVDRLFDGTDLINDVRRVIQQPYNFDALKTWKQPLVLPAQLKKSFPSNDLALIDDANTLYRLVLNRGEPLVVPKSVLARQLKRRQTSSIMDFPLKKKGPLIIPLRSESKDEDPAPHLDKFFPVPMPTTSTLDFQLEQTGKEYVALENLISEEEAKLEEAKQKLVLLREKCLGLKIAKKMESAGNLVLESENRILSEHSLVHIHHHERNSDDFSILFLTQVTKKFTSNALTLSAQVDEAVREEIDEDGKPAFEH